MSRQVESLNQDNRTFFTVARALKRSAADYLTMEQGYSRAV